MLLKIKLK